MMFAAINMKADWFVAGWLIPCGAAGAVIIGSWLVEAKQSVIENMAPVLTRLFTPLFTVLLLVFLGTMVWTGSPINISRQDRYPNGLALRAHEFHDEWNYALRPRRR